MGSAISKTVSVITYPIRSLYNYTLGENPNQYINNTDSRIEEFNKSFKKKEDFIEELKETLMNDRNSKLTIFNTNLVFNSANNLDDNFENNEDNFGENQIETKKNIEWLKYIMKLYTTDQTIYTLAKGNDESFESYFNTKYGLIKNNYTNIHDSITNLNQFKVTNFEKENFIELLETRFNTQYLRTNSYVQHLNLLLHMIDAFIDEINDHIRFFRQENRGILGNTYDYTIGFFTWMSRSGYSYNGTANFYTQWLNNRIRTIRNEVYTKIQSFITSNTLMNTINEKSTHINYHVQKNRTDRIRFVINNTSYDLRIGYYLIIDYLQFITYINTQIQNMKNPTTNENGNVIQPILPQNINLSVCIDNNKIVFKCDQVFSINYLQSPLLRIFNEVVFNNIVSTQVNNNHNIILSHTINEINYEIDYVQRKNDLKNRLTDFTTEMGYQFTQEGNPNA